ncbi:MAG: phage holin family protein [Acidobacteriota bacterium]
MWNRRSDSDSTDDAAVEPPGMVARLRAAWDAARDLIGTRKAILKEEVAAKGAVIGRAAAAFVAALVFGWVSFLLLTALVAVLFAKLFGSAWAGLLATFVLYGAAAGIFAFLGVRAFSSFHLFDFPETRKGLREDWETVQEALRETPEETGDETDLEARFRAGSE